ncbi:MAG: LolA family protein [Dichotomicrobium sp.]
MRRHSGRAVALALLAVAAANFVAAPAEAGSSTHAKTTPGDEQAKRDDAGSGDSAAAEAPDSDEPKSKTAKAESAAEDSASTSSDPAQEGALGALGGDWETDTTIRPEAEEEEISDEEALEVVEKINTYFNELDKFKSEFAQTDANNEQKSGEFYFKRPGKVRFDYRRPSRLKIISDGEYLAVENHDLKTSDRYSLDSTPFKLLLSEEVDLLEDARVLAIDKGDDVLILTLEDKTGESPGKIRLFFRTDPELRLASWIITDAQGLNTRVDLESIERDVELSAKLFEFSDIALPTFNR